MGAGWFRSASNGTATCGLGWSAWRGRARRVGRGRARCGEAGHGRVTRGTQWQGKDGSGWDRLGTVRQGRLPEDGHGWQGWDRKRIGWARYSVATWGSVWLGLDRQDGARSPVEWQGMAGGDWPGVDRQGPERLPVERLGGARQAKGAPHGAPFFLPGQRADAPQVFLS